MPQCESIANDANLRAGSNHDVSRCRPLPQFRCATHTTGLWVSSMSEHVFLTFGGKMARYSYRTWPTILEPSDNRPNEVGLMNLAAYCIHGL